MKKSKVLKRKILTLSIIVIAVLGSVVGFYCVENKDHLML